MKRTTRRRRSQSEIETILAEYRRSGLSQTAFCERRGVALSSLACWLSKERKGNTKRRTKQSKSPAQLVPVRIVDDPRPADRVTIEVESAHGYVLRVPVGLSPDLLARYVHALEARC